MTSVEPSFSGWKAVLDLGTNTFQLLVARKTGAGREVLLRRKAAVGLGKGGMAKKEILPEALSRALEVLKDFSKELNQMGIHPKEAKVLATSAFRNASNSTEVIESIMEETGFLPVILSGEQEAAFIFEGVKATGVLAGLPSSLIIDIGGGSVEFILCEGETAVWKKSIEVGGLRLMERFHTQDPLDFNRQQEMKTWLNQELEPVWKQISGFTSLPLVGCSGSFDTLVDMRNASQGKGNSMSEELPFHSLTLPEFEELYQKTVSLPLADRLQIPGMIPLRAPMMPVALVLIKMVLDKTQAPVLFTSSWSLKEGVIFSNQP